jgi:predicted nucleic acid-binding protein
MSANFLLDSCILIEYERGVPAAIDFCTSNKHAVSTVSIMEFDQGYKELFVNVFKAAKVIPLDAESASLAAKKIVELKALKTIKGKPLYSKEHLVRISFDAMIAATARIHGLTVVTNNLKDFKLFGDANILTL